MMVTLAAGLRQCKMSPHTPASVIVGPLSCSPLLHRCDVPHVGASVGGLGTPVCNDCRPEGHVASTGGASANREECNFERGPSTVAYSSTPPHQGDDGRRDGQRRSE